MLTVCILYSRGGPSREEKEPSEPSKTVRSSCLLKILDILDMLHVQWRNSTPYFDLLSIKMYCARSLYFIALKYLLGTCFC